MRTGRSGVENATNVSPLQIRINQTTLPPSGIGPARKRIRIYANGAKELANFRRSSIQRGQIRIAEHAAGVTNVADRAKVRQRKTIEPFCFVATDRAHRTQLETAVSKCQAAAAPVVDSLDSSVLECPMDKVISPVRRQVEARCFWLTELNVRLELLALNCRCCAALLIHGVQQRMTEADGG